MRLDDFRQALITTLQKAGLSHAHSADMLRSADQLHPGVQLAESNAAQAAKPHPPPNSFDTGLEMMMRSLRDDVDARQHPGKSR